MKDYGVKGWSVEVDASDTVVVAKRVTATAGAYLAALEYTHVKTGQSRLSLMRLNALAEPSASLACPVAPDAVEQAIASALTQEDAASGVLLHPAGKSLRRPSCSLGRN